MTGRPADPLAVLREALAIAWPEGDHAEPNVYTEALAALGRVEAELPRLREERDTARKHSREASEMYVQANEQITELLQQQSFMERKLSAQAEAAEARCARLRQALAKADKTASKAHDAMWAMDFDKTSASGLERDEWKRLRERASKAVWAIHDLLRPLVAEREALAGPDTPAESEWFIPEGDRACGVVHRLARATCMKRRGHEGSHATPQGTWIDGPWCEYPADSQEDKT